MKILSEVKESEHESFTDRWTDGRMDGRTTRTRRAKKQTSVKPQSTK